MLPSEYKTQLENIRLAAGELADKIERTEYASMSDLQRDTAQALELWQRRADLFKDMLTDEDILPTIDYKSEFGDL